MVKIRIDKFLSSQLDISRSDAKKLLKCGNVTVDGITVSKGDYTFNPENITVSVNGEKISYKEHIYMMLNKPKGVVSTTQSPGDVNVIDLVPDNLKRAGLFPAGRLDKDTTGFVLITDDGEFAHNILSPSKHISKTYIVTLEREVTSAEFPLFLNGMDIGDIVLKPAKLKQISGKDYEIVITEGRYHQIKRMFASTGNKVIELKRTKMGMLELDAKLAEGECRELDAKELELIREMKNDELES